MSGASAPGRLEAAARAVHGAGQGAPSPRHAGDWAGWWIAALCAPHLGSLAQSVCPQMHASWRDEATDLVWADGGVAATRFPLQAAPNDAVSPFGA